MKGYIIIFLLLNIFIFSFNIATANLDIPLPQSLGDSYGTFALHSNISLVITCTNETGYCDTCQITSLVFPSGSSIVIPVNMTKTLSLFNFTLTSGFIIEEGKHAVTGECRAGNVYSPFAYTFDVTSNGKPTPEGIIILGFVFIMLVLFMGITFFLIRAVGLMIDASFDILDLAMAWGLYFGILGLNQLAILYLGTEEVIDWLSLFIKLLAFPLVVVPVIAFFLSLFRENKTKQAERQAW